MHDDASERFTVDVASVSTREELHSVLSGAFGFPDYYGRNWDAFDECIRDAPLPPHLKIIGLASLHARLPREAELLERCVRDFVQESGHDITTSTA